MKQTTCRNLRGACDAVITGESAEAIGAAAGMCGAAMWVCAIITNGIGL